MESVLVFLVSIALVIVSAVTMTMSTIQSTAKLSSTWKALEQRSSTIQRTSIVALSPENYHGGTIDIVVKNEGQVNINDFSHWDLIAEEQDGSSHYLTFTSNYPPASNQWAIKGIYVAENVPEAFDINIFNPGEQVVAGVNPSGIIDAGNTIKITMATAEGITSQCYVTQQTP
jgi:hypothetical protein